MNRKINHPNILLLFREWIFELNKPLANSIRTSMSHQRYQQIVLFNFYTNRPVRSIRIKRSWKPSRIGIFIFSGSFTTYNYRKIHFLRPRVNRTLQFVNFRFTWVTLYCWVAFIFFNSLNFAFMTRINLTHVVFWIFTPFFCTRMGKNKLKFIFEELKLLFFNFLYFSRPIVRATLQGRYWPPNKRNRTDAIFSITLFF